MQAMRFTALSLLVFSLGTSVSVDRAMAQLEIGEAAQSAAKLINQTGDKGNQKSPSVYQDVTRKSPRSTVASFVAAMTSLPEPNYDQAYECMEFDSVASVTSATKKRLANDLLRIIGHVDDPTLPANISYYPPEGVTTVGFWVFFPRPANARASVPATLPPGSQPKAVTDTPSKTTTAPNEYADLIRASRHYQVKLASDSETGAWRFIVGPQTAELALLLSGNPWMSESIRSATRELTMTIGERIQWSVPSWMLVKTLGLRLWQWVGIAFLLGVGIVLDILLQIAVRKSARLIRPLHDTMVRANTLNRAARPTGLALAAIFWWITVHWLALPPVLASVIALFVTLFAVACLVWAGFRIADLAGEVAETKAEQEQSVIEDLTVPIVRKTIKMLIVGVALIVVAWEIGASAGTILAALGIFGAGVMLAAKDVIAHYFGSITLVSSKPFDVGDWVIIGDVEGNVEELGFRATKIRTFSNSEVTIPNSILIQENIDNYGRRQYRRWKTYLNLPFGTPVEMVEAFCEGIRELVRIHPFTRKDYFQVWPNEFSEDSLQILLYIFFQTPDWETELRERNRMVLDIMRLADYLGVTLSIPSRAIQFEQPAHEAAGELHEAAGPQTRTSRPPIGATSGKGQQPRQEPTKSATSDAENQGDKAAVDETVEAQAEFSGHRMDKPAQAPVSEVIAETGLDDEADQLGRTAAAAITADAPWRKHN